VDVTVSDANRQLALEKVMEEAQAYRKGGRKFQPVPKSGEKWPCVTLHAVPLLQPMQMFSGPAAGQQLIQALQQLGLLSVRPQAQTAAAAGAAGTAGAKAQLASGRAAANAPAEQQQQQQGVLEIKKGATDLKQLLQQIPASGWLIVAWTDSSSSSSLPDGLLQLLLQRAAAAAPRQVLVAAADAAASQSNAALAAALNAAKQLPVVQVFHNRQLVKAVKVGGVANAAEAAAKVQQAVAQLELLPVDTAATPAAAEGGAGSSKQRAAIGKVEQQSPAAGTSSSSSSSSAQAVAAPAAAGASSSEASPDSSSSSSLWDPPSSSSSGKPVKPGSKKKFPAAAVYTAAANSSSRKPGSSSSSAATVSAVYWPRMPCLSCGCPWWLGEDWDASCARCGWTCEDDGYDDDSNPLPEYRERYGAITAALKQGRTPCDLQPLE
jgi:hypothetical protein